MDDIYRDAQGHLTAAALAALKGGAVPGETREELLGHMARCAGCAERFAESFAEGELAPLPAGFAENVRSRLPARAGPGPASRRAALFWYSLRVAFAACLALLFLFSGVFRSLVGAPKQPAPQAPDFGFVDRFSADMRDFSQSVLLMGGQFYAHQKK